MTWTIQDEQRLASVEAEIMNLKEKQKKHAIAKREAIGRALGVQVGNDLVGIVVQYERPLRDALNSLAHAQMAPGGKIGAGDMIASLRREHSEENKRIALAVIAWSMVPELDDKRVQVARCIIDHATELKGILE